MQCKLRKAAFALADRSFSQSDEEEVGQQNTQRAAPHRGGVRLLSARFGRLVQVPLDEVLSFPAPVVHHIAERIRHGHVCGLGEVG
jgi:hypothetical protein